MPWTTTKRSGTRAGLSILAATLLAASVSAVAEPAKPVALDYAEVTWDTLMPKSWDPLAAIKGVNLKALPQEDPKRAAAMQKLEVAWSVAPTNPGVCGRPVRLSGFMLPLSPTKNQVREFLLVPYFDDHGHGPQPPANQVVHVIMAAPIQVKTGFERAVLYGVLSEARDKTPLAASGYRMAGHRADIKTK